MLETLWIFAVGLMPPLFSLWMMRRREFQMQAKLRRAMTVTDRDSTQRHYNRTIPSELPNLPAATYQESMETLRDRYYLEGVGYLVGDISCRFNARSCYLRCAVNPQGPCQDCRHYEPR